MVLWEDLNVFGRFTLGMVVVVMIIPESFAETCDVGGKAK